MTKSLNTFARVIKTKGASSLVEYVDNDVRKRVYIPSSEIVDGQVSNVIISRGIPYSYPFEEIEFTVRGADLAEAFHLLDLWTIEDVLKNPKKLRSALQATIASQLAKILKIAHGEKKGANNGTG
jgi:hypothetical protein